MSKTEQTKKEVEVFTYNQSKTNSVPKDFSNLDAIEIIYLFPDYVFKLKGTKKKLILPNAYQYSLSKEYKDKLKFEFEDQIISGKALADKADPSNVHIHLLKNTITNHKKLEEEKEKLEQEKINTRKKREALEEEKEKAQKEKEAAEQEKKTAQEAKESIQKVEETLQEYLAQLNIKAILANVAAPEMNEISTPHLRKELPTTVEGAYLSKNANRSSGLNNPAPNPKIDLKITFTLHKQSNSSGQENNLTRYDSPLLLDNTMPGATVAIYHNGVYLTKVSTDHKGNFLFQPKNLQNGPHEFEARAEYKDNKSSKKLSLLIKLSTETPTFEVIADDIALKSEQDKVFLVNNVNTGIKGTAEKNTQVNIFVGDKKVGVAEVDEEGSWSYQFEDNKLAQGDNEIKVVAEDKAKNTAEITRTINLDSIPPEAPSVALAKASQTHKTDPKITNQLNPTLEGKAEMGSKMALYLDGTLIKDDIPVDKEGHWSFTLDGNKADKNHNIEVFATDERGNRSEAGRLNFEIDNDIGKFTAKIQDDDNSSKKISKEDGRELTNIPHPKFEGEAKPGSKISVWNEKHQNKQEIEVDKDGKWVLTDIKSQEGPNKLIFDITDPAGNTAQKTFDYIDTIPPAVPSDILLAVFQTIDGTPTTASRNPTLTGKGEANSWIFIYLGEDNTPAGKTQVNPYGEWKYVFDKTLDPDLYNIRLASRDGAGNVSKKVSFTFKVQTEMDILEACLSEQSRSGDKTEKWKTKNTKDLQIEGTAESGANIAIRIIPKEGEDKPFGPFETTVGSDKSWLMNIGELPPCAYEVEITSKNKLGQDASKQYLLTIKTFIGAPQIEIDKDNIQVFQNSEGKHIINAQKPPFKITGEAGSYVTITLINKKTGKEEPEIIKEKIPLNGVLFFSIKEELEYGEYDIKAKLEDNLGNTSYETYFSFEIIAEMEPTIKLENQTPWDESVIKENEGIINKRTFTLSGEATLGANISLYKDGMRYGKMIRADDKTGKWKYDVTVDKDSQYEFFAKAEFNGLSRDSPPLQVTVDTGIESLYVELEKEPGLNEGYTKKTRPTFLVTVPKDVKDIILYDAQKRPLKVKYSKTPLADGKVQWTITLDQDLTMDQSHTIKFEATDHAKNTKDFDYTVHVLQTVQPPEIAFDGSTKTGTSDHFTNNKTPGFILRNIEIKDGQKAPKVHLIIRKHDREEPIETLTAQYDITEKRWKAVLTKELENDQYTATTEITYPDSGEKVDPVSFDFNIKIRALEPVIEPSLQDFMEFQGKWLTTKTDPGFTIKFDTEAIYSLTINVLDSSGKVIKTETLNENDLQGLNGQYDYTLDKLESNDYQLQVIVKDLAGNDADNKKPFHINTDAVEPVDIELIDHGNTKDFTKASKPRMKFTPKGENITKIKVVITGPDGNSKEYELTYAQFAKEWSPDHEFTVEGPYTVRAWAYRGDLISPEKTETIHFYQNAPEIQAIELDSNPEGFTNNPTPRLLMSIKHEDVHRAWKIKVVVTDPNGVPHNTIFVENENITAPSFYALIDKALSNGTYTVEATIIDKAGKKVSYQQTPRFILIISNLSL